MELLLTAFDDFTTFVLTTPFAVPAAVFAFCGGCWILAVACSKGQETEQ